MLVIKKSIAAAISLLTDDCYLKIPGWYPANHHYADANPISRLLGGMVRVNQMRKLTLTLVLISSVMITACGPLRHSVPVTGTLENVQIDTTVDDPIAQYYIERQTTAASETKNWDAVIVEIHSDLGRRIPSREQLALWSDKYSTDFATLILGRQLLRQAQKQPLYQRYSKQLNSGEINEELEINADVLFLFVPGWLYKTDPTTGADFSYFRQILREHGANTTLLQTKENGSVADNAEIIAEKLRQLAISSKTPIVIVSASKGGPETAVALSMIKREDAADNIEAWINVGGLLRGTPLADTAVTWPFCWFVEIAVLPDCSFDGVRGLTVANSMLRFREFTQSLHKFR